LKHYTQLLVNVQSKKLSVFGLTISYKQIIQIKFFEGKFMAKIAIVKGTNNQKCQESFLS